MGPVWDNGRRRNWNGNGKFLLPRFRRAGQDEHSWYVDMRERGGREKEKEKEKEGESRVKKRFKIFNPAINLDIFVVDGNNKILNPCVVLMVT